MFVCFKVHDFAVRSNKRFVLMAVHCVKCNITACIASCECSITEVANKSIAGSQLVDRA